MDVKEIVRLAVGVEKIKNEEGGYRLSPSVRLFHRPSSTHILVDRVNIVSNEVQSIDLKGPRPATQFEPVS
ncbi:hypothetical protein H0W91_04000 [Patescibacteria group bacterium]|nr:hypothetical protein [Patescibacteria group bacterium]